MRGSNKVLIGGIEFAALGLVCCAVLELHEIGFAMSGFLFGCALVLLGLSQAFRRQFSETRTMRQIFCLSNACEVFSGIALYALVLRFDDYGIPGAVFLFIMSAILLLASERFGHGDKAACPQ